MKALRDISAAFGWLSIVPVPAHADARPARWFPLVGWMFGGVGALVAWLAGLLGTGTLGSLLAGGVAVALWASLSRLLHWDGLADTFDGLLGGHEPKRRLEIMHDSRTGAFGATAIALGIALQVVALGALIEAREILPVLAAPVLGRLSSAMGLWMVRPARSEGLAARLAVGEGVLAWGVALLLCLPLAALATGSQAVVLTAGLLLSAVVPKSLSRPVGGITGDLLGASVVIVETVLLVTFALSLGA